MYNEASRPWLSEPRTRSTPQGKLMGHVLHLVVCWIAAWFDHFVALTSQIGERDKERERERWWQTRWWISTKERATMVAGTYLTCCCCCCWVGSDLASLCSCHVPGAAAGAVSQLQHLPTSSSLPPPSHPRHVLSLQLHLLKLKTMSPACPCCCCLCRARIPSLYLDVSRSPALRRNLLQADPSNVAAACLPATYNISLLESELYWDSVTAMKCESESERACRVVANLALAGQCKFRSEEKRKKKKKKMNALANLLLDA